MRGRLIDAWKYTWIEVWEPLEGLKTFSDDVYTSLFEELEKALLERLHYKETPAEEIDKKTLKAILESDGIYAPLLSDPDLKKIYIQDYKSDESAKAELKLFFKKSFRERIFVNTANDPLLARKFIQELDSANLIGDPALVAFFQGLHNVFSEYSEELCSEYIQLLDNFIDCHNLRYKLQRAPFRLQPHLPGIFASLYSEITEAASTDDHLMELMKSFERSFYAVSTSHNTAEIGISIQQACNFVEGLASVHPESKGSTLGEMCGSINCWPHAALREAVKKVYGFCSDYPGIRHGGSRESKLRPLDLRDSMIVSILFFATASYFLTEQNLTDIIGINAEDV